MKPVLSPKDVIGYLGASPSFVYELFRQKDFPSFRIGGKHFVKAEDFSQWLDQQKAM